MQEKADEAIMNDPLRHNNHGRSRTMTVGDELTGWMPQWLPPCSAYIWACAHSWAVEWTYIELFGEKRITVKASLQERCLCMSDEEKSDD